MAPPRGKSAGAKSDIRKCLRCSIILHEADAVKHDADCSSSNSNAVCDVAGLSSSSSPSSRAIATSPSDGAAADSSILAVTPNTRPLDDSCDGDGGSFTVAATLENLRSGSRAKKTTNRSFTASFKGNISSTATPAYGFVDAGS